MRPPSRSGHTTPELLVVLCLMGLVAALALERAARALDRSATRAAAAELATLLGVARDEAVARSRVVAMHVDTAGASAVVRAGSDSIASRALGRTYRVTLSATRDSVAFSALGTGYGAANARFVVKRGAAAETVLVSRLGRVRGG